MRILRSTEQSDSTAPPGRGGLGAFAPERGSWAGRTSGGEEPLLGGKTTGRSAAVHDGRPGAALAAGVERRMVWEEGC